MKKKLLISRFKKKRKKCQLGEVNTELRHSKSDIRNITPSAQDVAGSFQPTLPGTRSQSNYSEGPQLLVMLLCCYCLTNKIPKKTCTNRQQDKRARNLGSMRAYFWCFNNALLPLTIRLDISCFFCWRNLPLAGMLEKNVWNWEDNSRAKTLIQRHGHSCHHCFSTL